MSSSTAPKSFSSPGGHDSDNFEEFSDDNEALPCWNRFLMISPNLGERYPAGRPICFRICLNRGSDRSGSRRGSHLV